MKKRYETLDEYLDDLDKVKEELAKKLEGMTVDERIAYFKGARERLERKVAKTRRRRRVKRPANTAKR